MHTAKQHQRAEAKRAAAECTRVQAEHERRQAEMARNQAEGQRDVSEETRLTAEEMRQSAERPPPMPSPAALGDLQQRMHHLEVRMAQIESHVLRAMDAILDTTRQLQSLLAKQQHAFTQEAMKKARQMAHDAGQLSQTVQQRRQAQYGQEGS
jgi:hypothetical protein